MTLHKITSSSILFMAIFNSYYDYKYQDGELVPGSDYEALKSEVEHFNQNVVHGIAIEIEKV